MKVAGLQWALWAVGLTLQYVVLTALLQGPYREFRSVLVFVVALLITTITDIATFFTIGRTNPVFKNYYWAAELVRQSTLFAVVVSLLLHVIEKGRRRSALLRLVTLAAILFWACTLILLHGPDLDAWMTKVVRNLSFGSAVINLVVWFTLISTEDRDARRLLVAGGLGIQMTGEAIGQSVRHLFPGYNTGLAGSLLIVFTHFFCLLIWWHAFAHVSGPTHPRLQVRAQNS
jgi:hypothetical protein